MLGLWDIRIYFRRLLAVNKSIWSWYDPEKNSLAVRSSYIYEKLTLLMTGWLFGWVTFGNECALIFQHYFFCTYINFTEIDVTEIDVIFLIVLCL